VTPARRGAYAALLAVLALHSLGSAAYVFRTSVVVDGERTFLLWDDAMISMRYARNLANGAGLVWNAGEPVQGISNLGLTLVMALPHLLPIPPAKTSLALQAFALATLSASLVAAARWVGRVSGEAWAGVAAAALLAVWAPMSIWGLQGADTAAASLLVLWPLASAAHAEANGRAWPLGIAVPLALGVLLRLDGALALAAFVAVGVASPRDRRTALVAAAAGAATIAGVLAFGQLVYGDPLPNTYYLKATGSPRALVLASGVERTLAMLRDLGWATSGALALSLGVALWRGGTLRVAAAFSCAGLAYNVWTGGDWDTGLPSRFAVPALVVAFCVALALLARAARGAGARALAAALAVAVALGALAAPRTALAEWLGTSDETLFRAEYEKLLRFGHWLRESTDRDTLVALHWAGIPAYFGERPGLDVLGKSDATIARLEVDRFVPGHSKWDWDYVLYRRRPDLIDAPSRGLGARADFHARYRFAFTRRGGEPVTFFVRRGSEPKLHDAGILYGDEAVAAWRRERARGRR
jgi:hypothetical protein